MLKLVASCTAETVACVLPLGTLLAYHVVPPPTVLARMFAPLLLNTVALVTLLPQTRLLDTTPHFPLLEVNVNPLLPEGVAVKVAHVPVVYQVPALIMQPVAVPEVVTWRVPLPEKGVPAGGVLVGGEEEVVVVLVVLVVVEGGVPDLGRYLTPVAGQSDLEPSRMGGMEGQDKVLGLKGRRGQDGSRG